MGDVEANNMKTILAILQNSDVPETKTFAIEFLLGLTGSKEGLDIIYKTGSEICNLLTRLTFDNDCNIIQKSISVLINLSAEEKGANLILSTELNFPRTSENIICKKMVENTIISVILEHILNRSVVASEACMILANVSRKIENTRKIYSIFERPDSVLETIVRLLLKSDENVNFDYLAAVLSNLSQLPETRRIFLNPSKDLLVRILPLIDHQMSVRRRTGIIGTIRNLCFSSECHEWMLSQDVDLLPNLLLPLAGPEEFDDEDNEKLPIKLQYLLEDKTREPEPDIRKMLLEILMQLSATKTCREIMRRFNVYIILREYHKWETNSECLATCEDVVNVLIRTEEEIGADNLQNIEVPKHLTEKFNNM